jgi:hypothetical protein
MGLNSQADAIGGMAIGNNVKAYSFAELVVGTYNTEYTPVSDSVYNAADRLFVIGNGYDASNKSDAVVVLKDGTTTIAGTVTANSTLLTSDLRLKKNIVPINNGLNQILKLNPVSYLKKSSIASTDYSINENGFIAQELQKVIPALVNTGSDKDKLLTVNYTALIPVLTKAIQEQQQQIEAQQKQIDELKTMVLQLIKK